MGTVLSISDASFAYEQNNIFTNLSFELKEGEIICILGANGCGKTTLLSCLNRTLTLKKGVIKIMGKDITTMSETEIAKNVGFVFQEHSAPFPYKVIEVVQMGRTPYISFFGSPTGRDTNIALKALDMVGISHLKNKPYTQISGGERQLVLIAKTIAQGPRIIIMDEPTSHLDFKNQTLVLRMIDKLAKYGLSIILSSHYPNNALTLSAKVAMMNNGNFLTFGKSSEVLTENTLKATYGIDVQILLANNSDNGEEIKFCIPALEQSISTSSEITDINAIFERGDSMVKN